MSVCIWIQLAAFLQLRQQSDLVGAGRPQWLPPQEPAGYLHPPIFCQKRRALIVGLTDFANEQSIYKALKGLIRPLTALQGP